MHMLIAMEWNTDVICDVLAAIKAIVIGWKEIFVRWENNVVYRRIAVNITNSNYGEYK